MKFNHRGFTMIELIGALIIIAILTVATGFTATNVVHRSRVDATTADLQVFASDMEAVLEDIGVVELDDASTAESQAKIREYLAMIEANYTHLYFDRTTLAATRDGFTINTVEAIDPWGQKYLLTYNTSRTKGQPGTCILSSSGPNMAMENDQYPTGNFSDDICVIITPKS